MFYTSKSKHLPMTPWRRGFQLIRELSRFHTFITLHCIMTRWVWFKKYVNRGKKNTPKCITKMYYTSTQETENIKQWVSDIQFRVNCPIECILVISDELWPLVGGNEQLLMLCPCYSVNHPFHGRRPIEAEIVGEPSTSHPWQAWWRHKAYYTSVTAHAAWVNVANCFSPVI